VGRTVLERRKQSTLGDGRGRTSWRHNRCATPSSSSAWRDRRGPNRARMMTKTGARPGQRAPHQSRRNRGNESKPSRSTSSTRRAEPGLVAMERLNAEALRLVSPNGLPPTATESPALALVGNALGMAKAKEWASPSLRAAPGARPIYRLVKERGGRQAATRQHRGKRPRPYSLDRAKPQACSGKRSFDTDIGRPPPRHPHRDRRPPPRSPPRVRSPRRPRRRGARGTAADRGALSSSSHLREGSLRSGRRRPCRRIRAIDEIFPGRQQKG